MKISRAIPPILFFLSVPILHAASSSFPAATEEGKTLNSERMKHFEADMQSTSYSRLIHNLELLIDFQEVMRSGVRDDGMRYDQI